MDWFKRSKKKEVKNFEIKTSNDIDLKNKKNMSSEKDNKIKTEIEDSKSIPKKLELINQEYSSVVKNLMISKRELNTVKKDIEKSNQEYDNLVLKTKSARMELLKTKNELTEKNNGLKKITGEYGKQSLVIEEINRSKKELSEIKEKIEVYNNELESIKIQADNSPQLNSMKSEKKKLENEIGQKRNELKSAKKELETVENQKSTSVMRGKPDQVVEAASAVVASMNQKLQITLKELNAVKQALDTERKRHENTNNKENQKEE
jgi:chromosome segregation ATPase